jgi:phosphosulfolactate phosphohydrolase-like enzyme
MKTLEALFTPADFNAFQQRNLDDAVCVVFDIFRATSSMITALANGASVIIPVAEIPEALAIRRQDPDVLLAGERDGLRIRAVLTGGIDFDLGNSPREFIREKVAGKAIAITTTNGTRALRACAHAKMVLVGSFLNLRATADFILQIRPETLLFVCSGTFEEAAFEDVLGAGALGELLWGSYADAAVSDSALMARQLFQLAQTNLPQTAALSRNGRRLLDRPELKDDVAFCLQRDIFDFAAAMRDGKIVMLENTRDLPSPSPRPSGERAGVRGTEFEASNVEKQNLLTPTEETIFHRGFAHSSFGGGEGEDSQRFAAAIRRFDEENSRDPNHEVVNGIAHRRELIYSQWLTEWVLKLCPEASETLRLATRCQHLCRWMIPRGSYPMTRAGYLQWRSDLKKFHAQKSGEILREVGYSENVIERVQSLNLKKDFPRDPEGCVLEDALCLVFLEHQLADLASKTDDEKVVTALRKSWKKMTPAGHAEALKLSYGPREKALLERALDSA